MLVVANRAKRKRERERWKKTNRAHALPTVQNHHQKKPLCRSTFWDCDCCFENHRVFASRLSKEEKEFCCERWHCRWFCSSMPTRSIDSDSRKKKKKKKKKNNNERIVFVHRRRGQKSPMSLSSFFLFFFFSRIMPPDYSLAKKKKNNKKKKKKKKREIKLSTRFRSR